MPRAELVLYDAHGSPCARRVRVVLRDGTVVSEVEAAQLTAQLLQRLDHLERGLDGREFLVGDRLTIADVSVLPRVAMFPMVQVPTEPARHPAVTAWLARVGRRPSLVRSATVRRDAA